MNDRQAINAILFGAVLLALGLIPGPLAGLKDGMRNLRDYIAPFSPPPFYPPTNDSERLPEQVGLTYVGAAGILIGILGLVMK